MKTHQNSICRVACAVILASSAVADAQALFSSPTGNTDIGLYDDWTVGASFTVGNQAVTVTALGVYDSNQDGLVEPHAVGIWSSGGLIANTVVPAGTGAALQGSYRYVGITTLTLSANTTYRIGAYFDMPSTGYDPIGVLGTSVLAPAFSSAVPAHYSGGSQTGFTDPTFTYAAAQLWAANMLFTVVPEPSSLILTAASGLLILRRRRF